MGHTIRALLLISLCALLASGCAAMGATNDAQEQAPALLEPVGIKMDTAVAHVGEIYEVSNYDAAIVPHVEPLYFTVDGTIQDVRVIVGQQVKAGEVLLTIDQEAELARAQALREEIEYTRVDFDYAYRLKELAIEVLRVELEQLKAEGAEPTAVRLKELAIEQARADLRQQKELDALTLDALARELAGVEAQLGHSELAAPFDGRIVYGTQLAGGSAIKAYDPVLFLADDRRLTLAGEYISGTQLSTANEVYALIGDKRYPLAEIPLEQREYIATVLAGGTMQTRFELIGPPEALGELAAGMYAAVCVVRNRREGVLLVPTNALFRDAAGRYAYVVSGQERVRREVKVGHSTSALTEIVEGLQEGDVVYVKD